MAPLISIIIPVFNRETTIGACIESVLAQTLQDFEVWIVDDGSSDRTVKEIRCFSDPRINLICLPANQGAQAARNAGIRASKGEWIAFLDSDDVYYPRSLEVRLNKALEKKVSVAHSSADVQWIESGRISHFKVPALEGNAYPDLLRAPGPMFPGLLVHKRALEKIAFLDENIVSYQEWDTAIRLAMIFEFAYVLEPTFVYNCMGGDKISKDQTRSIQGYASVVNKHKSDILHICGRKAMTRHYLRLAIMGISYKNQKIAWKYYLKAWKWNPLEWRLWGYLPFFILDPRIYHWLKGKLQRGE